MSIGGKRPGAGRPQGARNKRTQAVIDQATAAGILPLDVMLEDMRSKYDGGDLQAAADRARDAAPYLHPRLASTESKVSGDMTVRDAVDRPPKETHEQWNARRRRELGLRLVTPAGSAD